MTEPYDNTIGPDPAEDRLVCVECSGEGPWDEHYCERCERLLCSGECEARHEIRIHAGDGPELEER